LIYQTLETILHVEPNFEVGRNVHTVLPLLGLALGTLGLVGFSQVWNNFLSALVVVRSPSTHMLPLALRILQSRPVHYLIKEDVVVYPDNDTGTLRKPSDQRPLSRHTRRKR
jgi:hypothetical protein